MIALLRRRVDALLIVPAGRDHRYLHDAGLHGHTVFLDRPPARTQADAVLIDNAAGARQGVEHLLAHGHGGSPSSATAGACTRRASA